MPETNALPMRFISVDVLRGLTVAVMLIVNNPGDWRHVYAPLSHTKWDGCSIADFVFPFFLFLVGVSINLSNGAAWKSHQTPFNVHKRILLRSLKLVLAGLALSIAMTWTFHVPHLLLMGTLQRIGVCYLIAAFAALYLSSTAQWGVAIAVLLGYALLLHISGSYAPFGNISDRVDNGVLGVHAAILDPNSGAHRDPDGLLSTFGALVTTLLGLRSGDWLRAGKLRRLWIAGACFLIVGYVLSYWVPINKKMWTATFVLWTGGWAFIALGLCCELFDRRQWPSVGRSLGVNAVGAYIASLLIFFALYRLGWWKAIYRLAFASWLTPLIGPTMTSLCYALAFTGLSWIILRMLDKRGWHLRF